MVKPIFGLMGSSVSHSSPALSTLPSLTRLLTLLRDHPLGITSLDTARVYAQSETLLGQLPASLLSHFSISTKAPAFGPGTLSAPNIRQNCLASLQALRLERCDIYYLHGPDRQTPLEEQCAAIDALYREGKFARFGVSNLPASEVAQIHGICTERGYVTPSVYQGGYNPLARGVEEELIPLLRRLGMTFYAFSPLAGGFFAKSVGRLREPEEGSRYKVMTAFGQIYLREEAVRAREELEVVCREHGVEVLEAVLRWLFHHSCLGEEDGVVLGAGTIEQAERNLEACRGGRLPREVVECLDGMWDKVKDRAWPYHS